MSFGSKQTIFATTLVCVAVFVTASLVYGASYLEVMLPGGLPLGNALTALGLCSAAGAAVCLSKPGSVVRIVCTCSFIATLLWLPVSIFLAGNLALNFSSDNGTVWLVFSAVIVVMVLVSLSAAVISMLLSLRHKTAAR